MWCHKCGTSNADGAAVCTNCGTKLAEPEKPRWEQPTSNPAQPPQQQWGQAPQQWGAQPALVAVPNYLVQSILTTIFCCLPLGVVAIVFSSQVNTKVAQGDFAGAVEASKRAKMFCWISFGLGLVSMVIWSAFVVAAITSGEF